MHLWLVRHAKSSWSDPGQSDHERPLNKRGRNDGPRMAQWLKTQPHPAQWVWTSDATRALQTTQFVAEGFALSAAAQQTEAQLYHASPETIVDIVRATPSGVTSVAVVAHNPGLTYLVNALAQEPVTDNLPTFGVAQFRLPAAWGNDWSQLQAGGDIRLEQLVSPKTL